MLFRSTNLVVSLAAVALLILLKFLVARSIVRSTDVLNRRLNEVSSGASDLTARIPVESHDEMGKLAAGINAVIAKINATLRQVLQMPETKDKFASLGSDIRAGSGEDFDFALRREIEKWIKVVKDANIKLP